LILQGITAETVSLLRVEAAEDSDVRLAADEAGLSEAVAIAQGAQSQVVVSLAGKENYAAAEFKGQLVYVKEEQEVGLRGVSSCAMLMGEIGCR
jgi:hypothetical protein